MSAPQQATQSELGLTDQELFNRLGWFINLRWVAGLGCTVTILFARHGLAVEGLPMRELMGTVLFILVYNAFCALVAKVMYLSQSVSRHNIVLFANVQIGLDLLALTVLIHFGGGVENFFIVFYIFHMVIASELLSPTAAALQATFAAVLLNAVAWLEALGHIPHVHLHPVVPADLYRNRLFVFEVCAVLTATLYIVVYLASSISARLRQREHEIERANVDLRSLDKQRTYFTLKVSHELRAPLAAMQSLLKVVLTGHCGAVPPKQQELIQRAHDRTARLLTLVAELLRYSRLRSTDALAHREPVAISDLARKVTDLFAPMAEERRITLRTELGRAVVEGDEEALEELVTNLVSNAIRYSPEEGSVLVRTAQNGTDVRLEVSDTGIGIEPEELPQIFEEFHRSPRAREFAPQGTGLGMAIVKRVVDIHHGDVRVESTPGEGSSFHVVLPAARRSDRRGRRPAH